MDLLCSLIPGNLNTKKTSHNICNCNDKILLNRPAVTFLLQLLVITNLKLQHWLLVQKATKTNPFWIPGSTSGQVEALSWNISPKKINPTPKLVSFNWILSSNFPLHWIQSSRYKNGSRLSLSLSRGSYKLLMQWRTTSFYFMGRALFVRMASPRKVTITLDS